MVNSNITLSNLLTVLTAFSLDSSYNNTLTSDNIYESLSMNQIVILGNSIEKQNLFNVSDDELVLYFTADPQLYWKCEYTNRNCINFSKQFKSVYNLAENCQTLSSENSTNYYEQAKIIELCKNIEGEYSNAVQSKLMAKMALTLRPNSSVLIINGDLTAFGHLQEFCAFSKFWLHFPIQLLPGLGNHDYENNIDDCFLNNCANRMLSWLVSYGQKNNLKLDYEKTEDNSSYVDSYNGSFSYTKTVCTENGITCVHIIQLHNRLGYTTEFSGWDGDWTIRSNIQWFDDVIKSYRHSQQPIFINLHQLDNTSLTTIVQVISKHFKGLSTRPQIFVLFAHLHSKHEIRLNCVGYKIPFIYVGSVPNNKFTVIKTKRSISGYTSGIYLLSSDSENEASIKQYLKPSFESC